jgi:hypothetical protein
LESGVVRILPSKILCELQQIFPKERGHLHISAVLHFVSHLTQKERGNVVLYSLVGVALLFVHIPTFGNFPLPPEPPLLQCGAAWRWTEFYPTRIMSEHAKMLHRGVVNIVKQVCIITFVEAKLYGNLGIPSDAVLRYAPPSVPLLPDVSVLSCIRQRGFPLRRYNEYHLVCFLLKTNFIKTSSRDVWRGALLTVGYSLIFALRYKFILPVDWIITRYTCKIASMMKPLCFFIRSSRLDDSYVHCYLIRPFLPKQCGVRWTTASSQILAYSLLVFIHISFKVTYLLLVKQHN